MKVGDILTRDQIKKEVGAGGDGFLLTKNNLVVAVALDLEKNPQGPDILLVGKGRVKEKNARLFVDSQSCVPTFVKRGVNRWEFRGHYYATALVNDDSAIETYRQHRPKNDISGIMFMEMDGMYWHNFPDEAADKQKYHEGGVKFIRVNAYERNAAARRRCIEHYGTGCQICGFNFEQRYGSLSEDYIHVHHIVPLSKIKGDYECDPIKDLIPVCANCHAILHRGRCIIHPEELKAKIRDYANDGKAR